MPYPVYDLKKIKPIVIEISAWVLSISASMILGLLSFSGILAIWPIHFVAFAALLLAVGYEGAIYLRNIRDCQDKLADPDYSRTQVTRQFILEQLADYDKAPLSYPLMIQAYVDQTKEVHKLAHHLHSQPYDQEAQETLAAMQHHLDQIENDIAYELFDAVNADSIPAKYIEFKNSDSSQKKVFNFETMTLSSAPIIIKTRMSQHGWQQNLTHAVDELSQQDQDSLTEKSYLYHKAKLNAWIASRRDGWHTALTQHQIYTLLATMAAGIAGLLMGFGTSYLLIEAFAVIPLLSLIPLTLFPYIIVPLSILGGVAYGQLICNSLFEMIEDNPITKFWHKLKSEYQQTMTLKSKVMLGATVLLFALSIFLTLCTAGTWHTIFMNTPLFTWITLIPNYILNFIIPTCIGLSILPFSIQNISNTLDSLEEHPKFNQLIDYFSSGQLRNGLAMHVPQTWAAWQDLGYRWMLAFLGVTAAEFEKETKGQKLNGGRILLRLTYEPLEILLFLGHLGSVGATADRLYGCPEWLSAGGATWLELFEDYDYFWGHSHLDNHDTQALLKERFNGYNGHDHEANLPKRALTFLFIPLFILTAWWENYFRHPSEEDNIEQRYNRLRGIKPADSTPVKTVPDYRRTDNHQLFLFKAAVSHQTIAMPAHCCSRVM